MKKELQLKQNDSMSGETIDRKPIDDLVLIQRMVDKAADMVFLLGPMGRIQYANEAACKALGYTREELQSMTIFDLNQKHHPDNWEEHEAKLKKKGSITFENVLKTKDNRLIPVEICANYAKLGDKEYNYSFTRDITERKKAERELEKYRENLEELVMERTRKLEDVNTRLQADIAQRKGTEQALVKERYILMKSQEVAHLGNWAYYLETREFTGSAANYRIYGYDPGETKPTLEWLLSRVIPEDRAAVLNFIEARAKNGMRGSIDYRIRMPDGSIRYVNAIVDKAVKDKAGKVKRLYGISQDITERKQIEDALRISQARLVKAQQMGRIGNWEWDIENDIEFRSEELLELFDFKSKTGTVEDFFNAVHPDDLEYVKSSVNDALKGIKPYNIDFRMVTTDNSVRYMHADAEVIRNEDGKPVKMFGIAQDITERKLAEKALVEAKQQAELYLDLMGHDINNMHQVALGYLELAEEHMSHGDIQLEYLEKPREVLQRSAQLIKNVRKLQKIHEGIFQEEDIDICSMLIEVKSEHDPMLDKPIRLNLNCHERCLVRANELLYDVFTNLVGNAVKHAGKGTEIALYLDVVEDNGRKYCRVAVEDDGPGIPEESKEGIFNRMHKGSARGMGIGLYLVRSLVDSYGGRVLVEDRVPGEHMKGARFVVMLPAVEYINKPNKP